MDLTWNIDNIYASFTCDEFLCDINKLEKYINTMNDFDIEAWNYSEGALDNIKVFLRINNEYEALKSKVKSYSYLKSVINVKDEKAGYMVDYLEDKDSTHKKAIISFARWLNNIKDLDRVINSDKYIMQHKFYLQELILKSKYLLSEKEEIIISKMQNIGSRAWQKYYMELMADSKESLIINGIEESLTLNELNNLTYDNRAEVRKNSFNKEIELSKKIAEHCAKCINGISGEANIIYAMRGYKCPLEKVLIASRMDVETLNSMIKAIEESLPMFHKYYRKKAKILKCKSKLPFYDLYADIGENETVISYEECKDMIVSTFNSFSLKLGEFANKAFENRWIDADPEKEKGNFGLDIDIFPLKQSRISVSFNNKITDVSILAHEIGHAYHSSNLYDETMLNTYYGTPVAETASIFCETLLINRIIETTSDDEKVVFLEKSISDAAYFIMEFYVRYLFEKELYERRKNGTLSVEELNSMMIKHVKMVYGECIDEKTINPYMWLNKVGYFMAGDEFLNFPYTFGVLFAKGLYSEYKKIGNTFIEKYDEFLRNTSKNNIVDAAKKININVHDINFWRSSLKAIDKDIEKLINMI